MSASAQYGQSKEAVRTVVIQLGGLSQILQSLMALRAAKQLYPNLDIHLVVQQKYLRVVSKVPWLADVHGLNLGQLIHQPESKGLKILANWIRGLLEYEWEFAVNWTFTEASSYICALLPAKIKLGYSRIDQDNLVCMDDWSTFVQAIVQTESLQNIHLTDILTTQLLTALQIHVGEPKDANDEPVTSKNFFSAEQRTDNFFDSKKYRLKKWVGVNIGTKDSCWSVENWARLTKTILEHHPEYNVVVFGSSRDGERVSKYLEELGAAYSKSSRLVSLIGRDDFDLWVSSIGRCQWVISGDSHLVQLASLLGTRVLGLNYDRRSLFHHGPYGNGHYIARMKTISAELAPLAVYGCWSYASSEWSHEREIDLYEHFEDLGVGELASGLDVMRSRIRNAEAGGGVVYESLTDTPIDLESWTSAVTGQVARAWYCGWVAPLGAEIDRELIRPELVKDLRQCVESSQAMAQVCDQASSLAVFLAENAKSLKSDRVMSLSNKKRVDETMKKIRDLDALMERISNLHSPLSAFFKMHHVMMANLRGKSLAEMSFESADVYRRLREGIRLFEDWASHTLTMARPTAVENKSSVIRLEDYQ